MPKFETPPPFRPYHPSNGMPGFWYGSFYRQRVDGLNVDANAVNIMASLISDNTRPGEGAPYATMTPFGQDNWNNSYVSGAAAASYFSDVWPNPSAASVTQTNWNILRPDRSTANPHPYFSDLRQQDATKANPFFGGGYLVGISGDRHATLWIPSKRMLVEAIGYSGLNASCEAIVKYSWGDENTGIPNFTLPLASTGGGPAGANAASIPVGPLFFTYDDLLECGETGDLGHMVGISLRNYGRISAGQPTGWYRWPARRSDGTIDGSAVKAGQVFRLKSTFNEATAFPTNQPLRALARTLKKYGMIVYDRNFNIAKITVPNDPKWPTGSQDLGVVLGNKLPLSNFEPVDMDPIAGPTNSIQVLAPFPEADSFGVLQSVSAWTPAYGGEQITLNGDNLTGTTKVVITGALSAVSFTVVDDNTLTFVAPPGQPGLCDFWVENIYGSSNILDFEYTTVIPSQNVHSASSGRMGLG